MMARRLVLLSFVLLALLLAAAPALAQPPRPYEPLGTVKVAGHSVPLDTVVGGWCSGVQYNSSQVQLFEGESWYALSIPGDVEGSPAKEGCAVGETVTFTIIYRGIQLTPVQTGTWEISEYPDRIDLTGVAYDVYLPLVIR